MAVDPKLGCNIHIALTESALRLGNLLRGALVLLPHTAAHGARRPPDFRPGPGLEALLVHILATGSPAPYDGLGAALVKFRETDRTVTIQGLAILVLSLRWRRQNRWGGLKDLDEFGLEQCELIDEMIGRIKHLFHHLVWVSTAVPKQRTKGKRTNMICLH